MSVNESEARLADLSRRTFLSMWSYQNPFYEEGKELCDVLIVFGDDVIIISDKVIRFADDKGLEVAWGRWYRKAILASVRQLLGALRTIRNAPHTIHLDAQVSSPFPLEFPRSDRARYHLIASAHGAEAACAQEAGTASLALDSRLSADGNSPLTVGVQFPEFVHVFNRTALDALFECFDTAADLVRYLAAKEALLKERRVTLTGEEDLIALYMLGRRPDGRSPLGALITTQNDGAGSVPAGLWSSLRREAGFALRRKTLAASYIVDHVIEQLANEYLTGRMLVSQDKELSYHANAFQILAMESRMCRMLLAQGVIDVLTEDPRTFWSVAVESADQPGVLYVWLVYPVVGQSVPDGELEAVVGGELLDYVFVAMGKFQHAEVVFGIALANAADTRTSRMFRVCSRQGWNEEMQKAAEALGKAKGIFAHIESTTYVAADPL